MNGLDNDYLYGGAEDNNDEKDSIWERFKNKFRTETWFKILVITISIVLIVAIVVIIVYLVWKKKKDNKEGYKHMRKMKSHEMEEVKQNKEGFDVLSGNISGIENTYVNSYIQATRGDIEGTL